MDIFSVYSAKFMIDIYTEKIFQFYACRCDPINCVLYSEVLPPSI